jgi:hypothetical protein
MGYDMKFREDMEIIREAKNKCKIYSASQNSHYWYPYKLRSVGKGWDELDRSCLDLILDSRISDDSVTNEDIVNEAIDSNANKIIPKDYINSPEKTRQSVIECEKLLQESETTTKPTIVPVLQGIHHEHLQKYEEFYSDYNYIAIGGMKGDKKENNTEYRVRRIKKVRDILGEKTHIHAFGMGASLGIIKAIRQKPNLIDSMDMSTAEQMVINGEITDWSFEQQRPQLPIPYGEGISTVNGGFSKSILIMLNYMLTDKLNEEKLEEMFYEELQMHKLQKIIAATKDEDVKDIDWDEVENSPQDASERLNGAQQELTSSFD